MNEKEIEEYLEELHDDITKLVGKMDRMRVEFELQIVQLRNDVLEMVE